MISHYSQLWVEKYRPTSLDDILLDPEIKNHFLSINEDTPHLLFYSSPGTGKSTLAKIIVKSILKCQYLYINASDENGVDTIRNKVISFAQTRSLDNNKKVVILEEADGLTGESLRILRNVMEEYEATTRFILTANYLNRIIEPIKSRCILFKLQPELKDVVQRCVDILKKEKISVDEKSRLPLLSFIEKNYPDLRRIINDLQKFSITGKLIIREENILSNLSLQIFKELINKTNSLNLRKLVIESEKNFKSDYQQLLKELFEVIYNSDSPELIKKALLLDVGEFLYRDNFVVDHEINFFYCILTMEATLSKI